MKRAFSVLLRLYPSGYRALFADEMAAVFEDTRRERRTLGRTFYIRFLFAELAGLLQGAIFARSLGIWQRRSTQVALPFLAGGVVTVLFLRALLFGTRFRTRSGPDLYTHDEKLMLVLLAAVSVVLIAGFSVAFVLNLRSLAQRRTAHPIRRHA